jgi:hypothetical protein
VGIVYFEERAMTATQWIVVASLAAVIVSALAIVAGLKGVRDQLRVTIFLEYTERYSKIMQNMPYMAREPGSDYELASQSEEERRRVLAVFREYLNLCSEEKWLHDQNRIVISSRCHSLLTSGTGPSTAEAERERVGVVGGVSPGARHLETVMRVHG